MENEPPSPFISLHLTPFRDKISFILFPTLSLSLSRYANALLSFILLSIVIIIAATVVVVVVVVLCEKKKDYERRKKVYDPTITVNKLCLCVPGIHLERERRKERKKIRRIRQKR